jgi:transcriptional regulator with XRE-family HTH domain
MSESPPVGEGAGAHATPELPQQLRKLRRAKSWTLEELASLSGVSRSMLSQIERGEANPTLAVAFRIARAFGVSLDDLVARPPYEGIIEVVRSDDPTYRFRDEPGYHVRTLSPLHLEKDLEFYEVVLGPGRAMESSPHVSGTREFLAVRSGVIEVNSGADSSVLKAGDSAYYPADVSHSIKSRGPGDAEMFMVVFYRD